MLSGDEFLTIKGNNNLQFLIKQCITIVCRISSVRFDFYFTHEHQKQCSHFATRENTAFGVHSVKKNQSYTEKIKFIHHYT